MSCIKKKYKIINKNSHNQNIKSMKFEKQTQHLGSWLSVHKHDLPYSNLYTVYCELAQKSAYPEIKETIILYEKTISLLETEFYKAFDETLLQKLKEFFGELEKLLALTDQERYDLTIVIPVANRPEHLFNCLESLVNLRYNFPYNLQSDKIEVIVADDSQNMESIQRICQTVDYFKSLGMNIQYAGMKEQLEAIEALSSKSAKQLDRIIGPVNKEAFFHKGPSIVRNILYLLLIKMHDKDKKTLFWFIDSDQEFQIRVRTRDGYKDFYSINYFYYLDRLFSKHDIAVLTGKVVGSPPVSPAVMAGNCMDDILFFLQQSFHAPESPCPFHSMPAEQGAHEAAYHDMAELFGFALADKPFNYACPLENDHRLDKCVMDFSSKLEGFFYGEHPTRQTVYSHKPVLDSVTPARTVYTGNYVFTHEGLKFFIPFATLRLRMAGPVLGRLIRDELGHRFVSANLPMLHKRTLNDINRAEFRTGIDKSQSRIDLSGEFERQFYGDVMLFTMEKLIKIGFPKYTISLDSIKTIANDTAINIIAIYQKTRNQIQVKLTIFREIFFSKQTGWLTKPEYSEAVQNFNSFLNNMENNFGKNSLCYSKTFSHDNQQRHLQGIAEAIYNYKEDMGYWEAALEEIKSISSSSIF